MPTEKKTESIHFKSFRRLAGGIVPDAPVVHTGSFGERAPDGAPDFLIRLPQRVLGIEHREVMKPQRSTRQVERAFEQNCDEILRMGREQAELRGLPPVRVSVFFGSTVPGARQERLALARALVDVVHDYMPEDKQNVRLDYEHFQGRDLHGIDTVHINRYDDFPSAGHWIAPRAAWVMSECTDLLQRAIAEKAPKYDRYRRHCDECWLLLVADSTKPSASIHPSDESLAHKYVSPFDRTFFLDAGMGTLHQLKTTT
jgi:hypothetical protein